MASNCSCVPVRLTDESSVIKVGIHDVKSGVHLRYDEFGGVANAGGGGTGNVNVLRGTTEYWNAQPSLTAERDVIYIYTNHATVDNGDGTFTIYPAIKIGDGTSYLIDMPFVDGELSPIIQNHINDSTIHVTAAEKDFWNNKWRGYIVNSSPENLVFTTE